MEDTQVVLHTNYPIGCGGEKSFSVAFLNLNSAGSLFDVYVLIATTLYCLRCYILLEKFYYEDNFYKLA